MPRIIKAGLLIFLLSGCAISDAERYNRKIIGSNAVYIEGEFEIVSDVQLSNLRVRHAKDTLPKAFCDSPSQNTHNIQVAGPINYDTPIVVERLIKKIKADPNHCTIKIIDSHFSAPITVHLSSNGGYLDSGVKLGKLLRKEGVRVHVSYGAKCASACAIAFLGGTYRKVIGDGELMFHAPYRSNGYERINCQSRNWSLRKYIASMIGKKNGKTLYKRIMSNCSRIGGWTINKDAADIMGITTR